MRVPPWALLHFPLPWSLFFSSLPRFLLSFFLFFLFTFTITKDGVYPSDIP